MTGCCRPRKGDAVEPVPVQAGSIIGMGNTIDSAASTQPYTAKYGGFDGSWESPTVSPAKAVAGKGPSLPAPLAELKALLQRNQLPLLPGFLVEKVRPCNSVPYGAIRTSSFSSSSSHARVV